jgi:hypothetical protein
MIREHDTVVLARDLPALALERGDVGVVVHVYEDGAGVEVEFISGAGTTVGVETLERSDVRPLGRGEILHARSIAA